MSRFLPLILISLLLAVSCRRVESNYNIEQADHPAGRHILAPGMGTLGLIEEGKIIVYYFMPEKDVWMQDKTSQFFIPEDNRGLLSLGMGTLGVLGEQQIDFYRLDQENHWRREDRFTFRLPRRYNRLLAVKMPWEMGVLAAEMNNHLEFFYHDGHSEWRHDETASFRIPDGIDHYFSMGNMTIAVVSDNKLGLYYLHPEGDWRFLDQSSLVLKLPDNYEAIIPFEPGIIAILKDNLLSFYELNMSERRWEVDRGMDFYLN